MSEQTARLVDQLRARLRATVQRITWAEAAFGAVITLGMVAAIWLLVATVEAGFWLGTTPRLVLIGTVAAAALGIAGYFLGRPLLQLTGLWPTPSEETVARRIGQTYPEVSDRLVNILQLAEGRRSPSPDDMVDRAVRSLGEDVASIEFEQIEDFDRARKASRLATLPIVGLLIFLIAAPSTFIGASQRLLSPRTAFERPAPFQLQVMPGDTDLVRGDSMQVVVRASGQEIPQALTLATRHEGEDVVDRVQVRADANGVFRHTLVNVRQSMRYRVEAAPVQSRWYAATVEARPLVRSLQVSLSPPAYTNLPDRRLDANVGDVTGLPGTRVDLLVNLGGPTVDRAVVAFDDGTQDTLRIQAGAARGQFTLRREGTYRIRLQSLNGVANRDPIQYTMQLRADAQPSVVFLSPDPVADLPESLEQPLRLRISDDFGFARLRLYYRVAERRYGQPDSTYSAFDLPVENARQLDQRIDYRWALQEQSGLDLGPGDVVQYYARVWDNDAVAGYKSARTPTQRLRLPSLAEKYEALDEEQNSAEQQMEEMMQETESISQQFDELRNELRRKQDADWEDNRQLEQIQQRQQQLEQNVNELSRQMEEMTRRMQENNLASPETMELYQEMQQVIEEINSPELQEALQNLQEAMQDLDMKQMQQAMENFEFNEQQYQERLQRSLELFKQIRMQQQLEEAARRTEDLSEQQRRLAEETQRRQEGEPAEEPDPESDSSQGADEQQERDASDDRDAERSTEADESTDASSSDAEQETESDQGEPSRSEQGDSPQNASDPQDAESSDASQEPPNQEGANRPRQEGTNEDLAQEQQRASEEMKELQEQLEELQNEMNEVRSAPKQQMQEMMQQMQEQDLPQQMQQNSQQLQQNQLQKARDGQQQMQQQLQQMQQRLQNMKQSMQGQQQQMNMAGLRQALENTLLLSRNQESLRHEVGALSTESPTLRRLAQDQVSLSEGLRTVSDSLQQLARQVPQMTRAVQRETGDALQEMQRATESLSERNARMASGHQKGSMMHLNELALLLSELLDQMMQGSGGGGSMSMQQMIQQLQQMSGDQQQLNQQLQQMLNDVQGNRLSVDQQERLQQMARQQQAIKRQLEQLNREGGAQNQLMGDLERIAEQMEESIRELQQNQATPRTIERQQQILTRMLNAQKSLRQQGREQQRQGQQSEEEFNRESPADLTREEQIDRLRRDLIRAMETGYAPDYEELIKRYFELLQQQEQPQQEQPQP